MRIGRSRARLLRVHRLRVVRSVAAAAAAAYRRRLLVDVATSVGLAGRIFLQAPSHRPPLAAAAAAASRHAERRAVTMRALVTGGAHCRAARRAAGSVRRFSLVRMIVLNIDFQFCPSGFRAATIAAACLRALR